MRAYLLDLLDRLVRSLPSALDAAIIAALDA
jgi:hypothetical protein